MTFSRTKYIIQPFKFPWVHHPSVYCAHLTIIFHASLSCAFLFRMNISSLHHSFTSSSHSLFGRSLFVFPFISPNITSFTSLLFFILQMCPNKFNLLSWILCKMFLLLPILFLISSFVIFFAILHLEFFDSISSQMPSVLVFFLQHPRFTCIQYYADYADYHNVSFGLYANVFAFPYVLELCHYSCCSSYLLAPVVAMC